MTLFAASLLVSDLLAATIETTVATTKRQRLLLAELHAARAELADIGGDPRSIAGFNAGDAGPAWLLRFSTENGAIRLGRDPYRPGPSGEHSFRLLGSRDPRSLRLVFDEASVRAFAASLAAAYAADAGYAYAYANAPARAAADVAAAAERACQRADLDELLEGL